ncbi:hypothetical protein M0802_000057 [Mischocyttarus mexicanus]|nr:hypothetical protein M0802_000057 [Mischocyttarus mexicanus]
MVYSGRVSSRHGYPPPPPSPPPPPPPYPSPSSTSPIENVRGAGVSNLESEAWKTDYTVTLLLLTDYDNLSYLSFLNVLYVRRLIDLTNPRSIPRSMAPALVSMVQMVL